MNFFTELSIGGWILFILGIISVILFLTVFVVTQQKTSKILTLFGKYYGSTSAGLSFKPPWPFVSVLDTVELSIQELKGEVTVKSSDNAFLTIPWALQFQVIKEKVKESYFELDDPEEQMQSYILNTLRGTASSLTMEQLFQSNDAFEDAVGEKLSEKFTQYGYAIKNVLVDDPTPSKDLRRSFDLVIASKREKEAAQNEAEAARVKMVGEAKAEGESLKIKAEAFKDFRKTIAEGNSEAMKLFLEDMENISEKDVLDFFAGVDLRDAIRDASKNEGNMVIVPVEFQNNITLPNVGYKGNITNE